MEYIFGPSFECTNLILDRRVSSVRFAGVPTDYKADTFTIYAREYFQGAEDFTTSDKPTVVVTYHESLIITGNSSWTVYDQRYYGGNSICLSITGSSYAPQFIPSLSSIGVPNGSIQSMRKGCFAENIKKLTGDIVKGSNFEAISG